MPGPSRIRDQGGLKAVRASPLYARCSRATTRTCTWDLTVEIRRYPCRPGSRLPGTGAKKGQKDRCRGISTRTWQTTEGLGRPARVRFPTPFPVREPLRTFRHPSSGGPGCAVVWPLPLPLTAVAKGPCGDSYDAGPEDCDFPRPSFSTAYCRPSGPAVATTVASRAIAVPMLQQTFELSIRRVEGHLRMGLPLDLRPVEA
jgi:hypothetical protein